MSHRKTIRAWKDPEYRATLSPEELALVPSNPAGLIDLTDAELGEVTGGAAPTPPINPKPHTKVALCPNPPKTSVERGCTVTASYLPCKMA
jgi:mersacidin/lichenicidin family type 2 lantibiotic